MQWIQISMQQMLCLSDLKAGSTRKTTQFFCHDEHPCWKLWDLVEVYHVMSCIVSTFAKTMADNADFLFSTRGCCNSILTVHISPLCCRMLSLGSGRWWRLLRSHPPWSGRGAQPWWDSFCRRELGALDMTRWLCSYESCFLWERLKFSCCFYYF